MVAATLTLTNCNKVSSIEEPASKLFTIRANTGADSKTTNDGMHTLWAENDKVSLLYAPAGTNVTSEFTNVPMTIASGAGTSSAVFKGEATLSGSNDFYAIYPHSGALKIPGQRNSGYIFVGNKNGVTQNGYDSMAHLSGSNCPMYGVALDNDDETIPEFSMKQLASVIELSIRSYSNEDFILKKVELLASEDIVGSYYIDITGTNPVYTPSDANYVSNTAVVNIENGAAVSKGSTIKVYIPIKPYVQAEGTVLHFVYTATVGGVTMTTTDDIGASTDVAKRTFHAGKIKRVSSAVFDFNEISSTSIADIIALDDDSVCSVSSVYVAAVTTKGYVVTDGVDNVYVFTNSAPSFRIGDKLDLTGTKTTYYGVPEIKNSSATLVSSDNVVPYTALTDITSTFDSFTSSKADYVTFTATVIKDGSYTNFEVTGATGRVGALTAAPSSMYDGITEGDQVQITGFFNAFNTSKTPNLLNVIAVTVEKVGGVTPPTPPSTTISSLLTLASSLEDEETSSESYTVENAKVMAINGGNVIVSDATGTILYYEKGLSGINAGDVVTMTGKVQNYHFLPEITSGSLTKTGSFTPDYSSPLTNFNSDSYLATKEASTMLSIDLIKIEGTFNENASVFTVDGQTVTYTVFDQTANANKTCVVVGYPVGMSNSSKVKILPVTVTPKSSPAVVVSPSELSWGATETSTKTVTVTCGNDWTVTGAPTWLTVTKVDATSFTVTPTANTGAARNATLTVTNSANSSYNATVSVTQAAPAVVKYTDVIDASKLAATNTTYTDFSNVTCVSPAVYAGQSAKDGSGNIQMRAKNSNSGIVTTTSGGTVAAVRITVGSGTNRVDVYGTNTAYTSAADLYKTDGNSNQGTLLGSVTSSGTITVTGDYKYIGIRSYNGAIYITKIEIDWK